MVEIEFHPEALSDSRKAVAWYCERSVQAANKFANEMERMLGRIATTPLLFPAYDDDHRYAMLTRYPYSIIFRVESQTVKVIAIAHASRSSDFWRDRV